MKAKITGMSSFQGAPLKGTLTVWPDDRYEDGSGNATVARLDYVLDVATRTWRDAHNPAADAYLIVAAPGEPEPVSAMFEEVIEYAGRGQVRTLFRRYLVASDLNATEYSYVEPQNVVAYSAREPLTMQAARQLLSDGTAKLQAMEQALADSAQSQAQSAATAGLIPWSGGDHTTLPAGTGNYRIMTGPEAGQVWTRTANGAAPSRSLGLEAISLDRIVAQTVNAIKARRGNVDGEILHYKGRPYAWDSQRVNAGDDKTILAPADGGMGRWVLVDEWAIPADRYDITGDGIINETAKVNAALAWLKVIGGGTLKFRPRDVVMVDGTILALPSGATIEGNGATFKMLAGNYTSLTFFFGTVYQTDFDPAQEGQPDYDAAHPVTRNVTVRNLNLDGNIANITTPSGVTGFHMYRVQNFLMEGVTIRNLAGTAGQGYGFIAWYSEGVHLVRVIMDRTDRQNVMMWESRNTYVDRCDLQGSYYRDCIAVGSFSDRGATGYHYQYSECHISNSRINNRYNNIAVDAHVVRFSGNAWGSVMNCDITGNPDPAVGMQGIYIPDKFQRYIRIIGNRINGVVTGIESQTDGDKTLIIEANQIFDVVIGVKLNYNGGTAHVIGNTVKATGQTLYLNAVDTKLVLGNTFIGGSSNSAVFTDVGDITKLADNVWRGCTNASYTLLLGGLGTPTATNNDVTLNTAPVIRVITAAYAVGNRPEGCIVAPAGVDTGLSLYDARTILKAGWARKSGVLNGHGLMGSNWNWGPNVTADSAYTWPSGVVGALSISAAPAAENPLELEPVTPEGAYLLTVRVMSNPYVAGNGAYGGIYLYDADGQQIQAMHRLSLAASRTTLAAPLKPGDTTITLTNGAGWNNAAGSISARRNVQLWGYKSAGGQTYAGYTYTRYVVPDAYADGGVSGNVITLRSAWTLANPATQDGSWPAGTLISGGESGADPLYLASMQNVEITATEAVYTGVWQGMDGSGNTIQGKFPIGTAYIRPILLCNRNGIVGNTTKAQIDWVPIQRAPALTAATPATTALTASATYTQAEITAIITRAEQLRVRLADLESKLKTANLLA